MLSYVQVSNYKDQQSMTHDYMVTIIAVSGQGIFFGISLVYGLYQLTPSMQLCIQFISNNSLKAATSQDKTLQQFTLANLRGWSDRNRRHQLTSVQYEHIDHPQKKLATYKSITYKPTRSQLPKIFGLSCYSKYMPVTQTQRYVYSKQTMPYSDLVQQKEQATWLGNATHMPFSTKPLVPLSLMKINEASAQQLTLLCPLLKCTLEFQRKL